MKIEDLILLILRCLLVALAVIAFARPVLQKLAAAGADSGDPVATVVLLDHSASMAQSSGMGSLFDVAKKEIDAWTAKQSPDSLFALYLVSNRTEPLIAKPTRDRGSFQKSLAEAGTSDRGSDLAQGVRQAMAVLKTVTGRAREIRIYTDGQANAWLKNDEIVRLAKENPDIRIKPVLVVGDAVENAGIVSFKAAGGLLAVRQPCEFQVEVANFGTRAVENLKVTLSIDGGTAAGEQSIARIEPGATQAVSISIVFPDAGPRAVVATIPPDAFSKDNRRTTAVDVVSQMNVLIASENNEMVPRDRAGFFVGNALIPLAPDQASRHYLTNVFVSPAELPAELTNANSAKARAVILCDPGVISAAVSDALVSYVKSGGQLWVFSGANTRPDEWRSRAAFWEMLPAEIAAPTDEAVPPLAWQDKDFTHPVTALWNDPAQGSLGAVKFSKYFPLTVKGDASRVVIRMATGGPSAVEWNYGEGAVVLFNSTPTPEWNNFPLHPAFVPFMQRLMEHLDRANQASLNLAPGEAFRKAVGVEFKEKDFSVRRPGSDSFRTAGQVVSDDQQTFIRYADTGAAGAYRVNMGADLIGAFAVQMDPAESDLRKVDPAVIAELENLRSGENAAASPTPPRMVVTREFWTFLMWVVAGIFIIEAVMAHRISLAR